MSKFPEYNKEIGDRISSIDFYGRGFPFREEGVYMLCWKKADINDDVFEALTKKMLEVFGEGSDKYIVPYIYAESYVLAIPIWYSNPKLINETVLGLKLPSFVVARI